MNVIFRLKNCNRFTISWATSSGTSLLRSNENSIASLSLYFPLSFFTSSILSHSLIASISPSSSSANSIRTPVSSWKKAWFRRSLIEYLNRWRWQLYFSEDLDYLKPVEFSKLGDLSSLFWRIHPSMISFTSGMATLSKLPGFTPYRKHRPLNEKSSLFRLFSRCFGNFPITNVFNFRHSDNWDAEKV